MRRRRVTDDLLEYIESRCIRQSNGCLVWQGATNHYGYGLIRVDYQRVVVHRLAYTLRHGNIPDGRKVCHTCDNGPCIEDTHHFLGTSLDNSRDMVEKGRQISGNQRLTIENVRAIRAAREIGIPLKELSIQFAVAQSTISAITHRRLWANV